jgi:hypothetical protein
MYLTLAMPPVLAPAPTPKVPYFNHSFKPKAAP